MADKSGWLRKVVAGPIPNGSFVRLVVWTGGDLEDPRNYKSIFVTIDDLKQEISVPDNSNGQGFLPTLSSANW